MIRRSIQSLSICFSIAVASSVDADQPVPRPPSLKPGRTTVAPFHRSDAISVKFRDDLSIRTAAGALNDGNTGVLGAAAKTLLARFAGGRWDPAYSLDAQKLEQFRQTAQRNLGKAVADLRTEFVFTLPAGADAATTIDAFNGLDVVEIALPLPRPVPPPLPPNFQSNQGYLNAATVGISALGMWVAPYNATGTHVHIADVEYSWNFNHQDIPPPILVGPAPVDPFNDNNHGTAVLGEISSRSNSWGTTGIAFGAGSVYVVAANTSSGYNVGAAIMRALTVLGAGDVLLIEQQFPGPNYTGVPAGSQVGLIPVEWFLPYYNAIVTAVGNNIVVVEAGGNGDQDLDAFIYHSGNGGHWPFLLQNDSGAIIVGAGAAPGSPSGDRSRLPTSCYGATVDLQGWGHAVFTTGYGNAYSAEGVNLYYTNTFTGTSSASGVIAGACALLQDYFKGHGLGAYLTPHEVKMFLRDTGSPQQNGGNPASQNIGPRPNLTEAAMALSAVDRTPPVPNPMYFATFPQPGSATDIMMNAAIATDSQSNPVEYRFEPAPGTLGHDSGWTSETSYQDVSLTPNTLYAYRVKARDSANPPNETQPSFYSPSTATLMETPQSVFFSNVTDTSMMVTATGTFTNLGVDNSALYFEVTPYGGFNSNVWTQNATIFLDNLTPGTTYFVRAKSRNRLGDEGPYGSTFSQTTSGSSGGGDTTPPSPNPMFFASLPAPDSASTISMSATSAIDVQSPPVQYYFESASGLGHDSGWSFSQFYSDFVFSPNSEITYRVKARDSAFPPNETFASSDATTATLIETPSSVFFGTVASDSIVVNAGGFFSNLFAGQSGLYYEMLPDVAGSGANVWTQNQTITVIGLMPGTTYTFRVKARNRVGVETQYSFPASQSTTGGASGDHTPPAPNPMFFTLLPAPDSTFSISMAAATAVDSQSPPVEYYFQSVSGFGHDSGWTWSEHYTDFVFAPNAEFAYRVKARDSANPPNETTPSFDATTATWIETPTGIFFGAVTNNSIQVNAGGFFSNLFAGQSGLYFEMTPSVAGSGANMWTQSTSVTVTGLSPATIYTFCVKARNRLGVETVCSPPASQATSGSSRGDCDGNGILQADIDTPCFVDVLLGINTDPGAAMRMDLNQDGVVDGLDIPLYVQCVTLGCP